MRWRQGHARGLSLYTTRTGTKNTSHWYLHAVLILQEEVISVKSCSHGAMGFTPLAHPGRLAEPAGFKCTPAPGFLATLAPV
ncbi:hypothetical protein C8J30_11474 [Rhodobacter viridis]|uniref:Uncharacterized protein n=1 Tax=Rhodobacter viridis TaxID=1054202 RepID=A0A318TTG6_9RHOB|nr:hypothetical protein C8J30_11474 [Rhodobacter viridis]